MYYKIEYNLLLFYSMKSISAYILSIFELLNPFFNGSQGIITAQFRMLPDSKASIYREKSIPLKVSCMISSTYHIHYDFPGCKI